MKCWIIIEGSFYSSKIIGVFSSFILALEKFDQLILTKRKELFELANDHDLSLSQDDIDGFLDINMAGDHIHEFGKQDIYYKLKEYTIDQLEI
jgi:hypothetical protein